MRNPRMKTAKIYRTFLLSFARSKKAVKTEKTRDAERRICTARFISYCIVNSILSIDRIVDSILKLRIFVENRIGREVEDSEALSADGNSFGLIAGIGQL